MQVSKLFTVIKCLHLIWNVCEMLTRLFKARSVNRTNDIDPWPYDWLSKFYSCYMAIVVSIVNGHGLDIDMHFGH